MDMADMAMAKNSIIHGEPGTHDLNDYLSWLNLNIKWIVSDPHRSNMFYLFLFVVFGHVGRRQSDNAWSGYI